jgi:hypothetical protein
MFYDGANGESVYITNSSASDNLAKVTGSAVYSNSQYFSFEFEIPVAAWTSSGTVNLAQNDVEYVYNTTVTDADDTTAFGYGPGGGQFPGVTTTSKTKRVRFLTPIQTTDHIVLETSFDAGVTWGEVGQHEEDSAARYQIQNTLTYGMQLVHINSTDLDVRFGIHRTVNPSVGYGSAGSSWTDIDANNTYKWRVKKVKSGQAVGFGLADTAGNAGLVNPYSSSGAGVVYSGTWTPTLTNTTNIDSSTAEYCIYSRIGKIVSGHMRIQINPTADNATTTLGISLPIASAFTSGNDAIGNGTDDSFDGTVANNSLRLAADSTNDRFTYNFTARDTGAATHYISFSYEIK